MATKSRRTIERSQIRGIIGVDGVLNGSTKLYDFPRSVVQQRTDRLLAHSHGRANELAVLNGSDPVLYMIQYLSTSDAENTLDGGNRVHPLGDSPAGDLYEPSLPLGLEVPLQRKNIDRTNHPQRFLDTKSRIWPSFTPTWDPERALAIRSQQLRGKT